MAKKKTFILSTENPMKVGEVYVIVKTDGIDLSYFSENPVMLADHDWSTNGIIGAWMGLRKEDGKLVAEPRFATKKPYAIELKDLVEEELLNVASIGVEPLECHVEEINGQNYLICDKSLALEASLCGVPKNRGCIAFYDKDRQLIEDWTFSDFIPNNDKTPKTNNMDLKKVAQMLGLSENATEMEVTLKLSENAQAGTQLQALLLSQKNAQKAEITALVDKVIAENRLDAMLKTGYLTLAEADFNLAKATLESLPFPTKLSDMARQTPSQVVPPSGAEAWTFSDHFKKGTLNTLSKDQYNDLYRKEFGILPEQDISPSAK